MIESKKLTRIIIIGAVSIVLICIAAYIFTHKFITLHIENPDHIDKLSYHATTATGASVPALFGLHIVGNNEPIIKVTTASGEETVIPITSLPLFTADLPVTLQKTKQANVYSSQSLGCNSYNPAEDRVMSYKCATAASALYTLDSSTHTPWRNTKLLDIALGLSYYNYTDGVLALTASDASERMALVYSATGLRYYKLDDTASRTSVVDVAVDATNRSNTSFAVYSPQTGDVAYYTFAPGSTQPTAHEYHPDKSDASTDSDRRSRCVLSGTKVYCLRGTFTSPNGDDTAGSSQPVISEIDFSKSQASAKHYPLSNKLSYLTGIHTDAQQRLYITNDTDLYQVNDHGAQLVYPHTTTVASGQQLVFTSDRSLYRINPAGQAIKAYTNDNFQLSNISSYGDSLLFDVFSKNDTLFPQGITLKLSAAPDDKAPSILNILPLAAANLPITSAALSHDTLQILPTAYATSDRETGTFSYDKQQYADSKAKIEQYLNDQIRAGKLPVNLQVSYAE